MGTPAAIIYSFDLATVASIIPAFANRLDILVVDEVRGVCGCEGGLSPTASGDGFSGLAASGDGFSGLTASGDGFSGLTVSGYGFSGAFLCPPSCRAARNFSWGLHITFYGVARNASGGCTQLFMGLHNISDGVAENASGGCTQLLMRSHKPCHGVAQTGPDMGDSVQRSEVHISHGFAAEHKNSEDLLNSMRRGSVKVHST